MSGWQIIGKRTELGTSRRQVYGCHCNISLLMPYYKDIVLRVKSCLITQTGIGSSNDPFSFTTLQNVTTQHCSDCSGQKVFAWLTNKSRLRKKAVIAWWMTQPQTKFIRNGIGYILLLLVRLKLRKHNMILLLLDSGTKFFQLTSTNFKI